ncbi:FAD dependent oxidoreductase [Phakopsora pachyrhizi]|nr:FAD dependent oxidoreductase [Phakopsora pachyrhizi]
MSTTSALRLAFPFLHPEVSVDHLVIGAGAVGLAVGRELTLKFKEKSTYLLERHHRPGQETSSRNSEVIHAGIYYTQDSLKTALCIRGRILMYDFCQKNSVPYQKTGKLIISKSNEESNYIERLYQKCQSINHDIKFWRSHGLKEPDTEPGDLIPLKVLKASEAIEMEPDLSKDLGSCLYSPETGILDSHSFMEALESSINESENGEIVYGARVVRIDRASKNLGWVVQTATKNQSDEEELSSVMAKCVVNCAGLNAHNIYNHVLNSKGLQLQINFCKGNYFSYSSKKGVENVKRLIYPTPVSSSRQKSFSGLGTHLTLDLNRKVKFGPDVEWLPLPVGTKSNIISNLSSEEEVQDFWQYYLKPSDSRQMKTYESVRAYLPGVELENFVPDYCGIRPKLKGLDEGQNQKSHRILSNAPEHLNNDKCAELDDFFIRQTEHGFINLFGIESPGLTSSLAIGEYVEKLVREKFWIQDDRKRSGSSNKSRFCEIGELDSWV